MDQSIPTNPVVFIAGATSPRGRLVAELAAVRGASVYMTGRNEEDLQGLQDEFHRKGYRTAYAVADVAELPQLEAAAEHCLSTFGKVTSWINLPGPEENDGRKLFESIFWSTVNGTRAAIPLLAREGGRVVNVHPTLEHLDATAQGYTTAAIRAIKEFTRALRRDLGPVSVRNFLPREAESPMEEAQRIIAKALRPSRRWFRRSVSPGKELPGENFQGVERKRHLWPTAMLFLKKMR